MFSKLTRKKWFLTRTRRDLVGFREKFGQVCPSCVDDRRPTIREEKRETCRRYPKFRYNLRSSPSEGLTGTDRHTVLRHHGSHQKHVSQGALTGGTRCPILTNMFLFRWPFWLAALCLWPHALVSQRHTCLHSRISGLALIQPFFLHRPLHTHTHTDTYTYVLMCTYPCMHVHVRSDAHANGPSDIRRHTCSEETRVHAPCSCIQTHTI